MAITENGGDSNFEPANSIRPIPQIPKSKPPMTPPKDKECLRCGKPVIENALYHSGCAPTKEDKIRAGAKDFAERFEPVMRELAEEDWTKEFDAKFTRGAFEYRNAPKPDRLVLHYNLSDIKSFIRSQIEKARIQGQHDAGYDAAKVFEAGKAEGRNERVLYRETYMRGYQEAYQEVRKKILEMPDDREPSREIYKMINAHTLICWLDDLKALIEKKIKGDK